MITVIGMIKNAADVIETYIRANGLFADNFVLLDNCCTDRTIEILESLQKEGYDIEILKDDVIGYFQNDKMTSLAKYVVDKYDTDFVVPLDDDEILYCNKYDLKLLLEGLPKENVYYARWKVYVPTEDDDMDEICCAKRQKICYVDGLTDTGKAIVPSKICRSDDFNFSMGNHIAYTKTAVQQLDLKDVVVAHYPCRSKEQLMSKTIVGNTAFLLTNGKYGATIGSHWGKMYEKIKAGYELTIDDQWKFCINYLRPLSLEELEIELDPIILPKEAFEIKYTGNNEVNYIQNYMLMVEEIIDSINKKTP